MLVMSSSTNYFGVDDHEVFKLQYNEIKYIKTEAQNVFRGWRPLWASVGGEPPAMAPAWPEVVEFKALFLIGARDDRAA